MSAHLVLTVRNRVVIVQHGYGVREDIDMPWRDMLREVLLPMTIGEGIVLLVLLVGLVWL